LGRSEEHDDVLCTIFRATKADVTAEYEGFEEVPFEVEGFNFSFDEGEGVTTFMFECRVFFDEEGVSSASGGGVFLDSGGVSVALGEGEAQHVSLEGSRV